MLNRLPIKVSAPTLVALPVLVVGILLSLTWSRQSHEAVTELAIRNIEQVHDLTSNRIAEVLANPARICRINAELIESGMLDPRNLATWREMFFEQMQAFDMLSAVTWGDAEGRCAWVCNYADGSLYWGIKDDPASATMSEYRLDDSGRFPNAPTSEFNFDLFTRPWFSERLESGESGWSEPYVWLGATGSDQTTVGVSYGIPLYADDGTFIGVADADFTVTELSDFLASVRLGTTGVAAIVTSDGHLLATSNGTPIVQGDGERITMAQASDELFRVAASIIDSADHPEDVHREVMALGEVHYLRTSPLGAEVGLDWTLATVIPERDFIAEIERELRRSSTTSLLAVISAIIVGVIAARWLVTPLITLVTAVRRIGRGDLDTHVGIRHAPEYVRLADEINEMTVGLKDRMRMRESLSLAMEVQKNLLPSEDPVVKGLDIAAHSTYCDETGGDYYDFLDVSGGEEDTLVVALGDVMGHGVAAAMLMATARGILRSRCTIPGSLAELLTHLNQMLVPDTGGTRFMTMQLITLNAERRELRWASAGHGPPIIYDPATDHFSELDGGGIPLGIYGEEEYEEYTESNLAPGCIIISATDGLWEAKDEKDVLFGTERLQELIRRNAQRPAAEISEAFRDALARHRGKAPQDDDLTFVITRVL